MLVCLLVPVSVAHLRHHSRELDCRWLRVERSPEASKGEWFSQRARLRLCDSHNFPTTLGDRRAPVLPGILQALLLINNAGTRCVRTNKRNENCRFAHLSRLRSTAASKRCIRTSRATVLLSPRALSSMPRIRVRRGAAPRYPWRTHTLCTHIRRDRRPRLSFAARGNFTE